MKVVTPICGNTVAIAYQAENNRTQVRFDLSDIVREFPGGTAALVIRRHGDADPVPAAQTEMDGTVLVWTITAWECAKKGFLHAQVVYSAGDTVAKTKIYRFDVADSITATAEEPDGWQDWVGQLMEAAAEVVEAVESYDAITAEATGLAAGEEPTAVIDHTGDHPVLQLGIPKGEKGDTGATGQAGPAGPSGVDGFSPTAGVSKVGKIATITIVDKNGTTTASVSDGADGDPGDIIDDTAGAGDTDKTFSADKLTAMNSSLLNAINRKFGIQNVGRGLSVSEDAGTGRITLNADVTQNDITNLQQNKAAIIITNASGSIASISDGADDLPVESMTVQIEPVQSGSGDPSPDNVRPISGWTGCNVTRTGKNLIYPKYFGRTNNGITYTVNSDGTITTSGTATASSYAAENLSSQPDKMSLFPAGTYSLTGGISANEIVYLGGKYIDGTSLPTTYDRGSGVTFTLTKPAYVYPQIQVVNGTSSNRTFTIQLEVGSATAYAPYQGETYPITWEEAGTVYGGTVNPVTGKLIVTDAEIESYNGETLPSTWISDRDVYAEGTTPTIGAQVVYKLAEPLEYDLDSITVNTLLGYNAIFADTGDVAVDYRADTKLWINGHSGSSITVDSALSSTSKNPVQNKVINTALAAKEPKHNTTTVSGTTPSITGVANTRYVCGEVSTLTIIVPASGCIDVTFTSGSTPTVLTVTPPTGVTAIKWANGFDPSSLDANTVYEINILDGEYGVVGQWT